MSHPAIPPGEAIHPFQQAWITEPWVIVPVLLTAGIYVYGWRRLHQRAPARATIAQLATFLAGLGALALALLSPLHALGSVLLQAHMAQHLLLLMVAPWLLCIGAPLLPILHAIPQRLLSSRGQRLFRCQPLLWLARRLTHPVLIWLLFVGSTWAWHVPTLYERALASEAWHHLQHLSFLASGLAFWIPVCSALSHRAEMKHWGLLVYLVLADLQNTILAASLIFSERLLYPTYDTVPRLFGLSPLDDQAAAGALMWVPGSIAFLLPAAWIVAELLSPQAHRAQASSPRRSPPVVGSDRSILSTAMF